MKRVYRRATGQPATKWSSKPPPKQPRPRWEVLDSGLACPAVYRLLLAELYAARMHPGDVQRLDRLRTIGPVITGTSIEVEAMAWGASTPNACRVRPFIDRAVKAGAIALTAHVQRHKGGTLLTLEFPT